MANKAPQKKAPTKAPVVEVGAVDATVVDTVETDTPAKDAPKKEKAKKVDSFDPKTVSQSTRTVNFEWSKGKKKGTKETMSENIAEIMEYKGLGKQVELPKKKK